MDSEVLSDAYPKMEGARVSERLLGAEALSLDSMSWTSAVKNVVIASSRLTGTAAASP